jgi:hypothetical protein
MGELEKNQSFAMMPIKVCGQNKRSILPEVQL